MSDSNTAETVPGQIEVCTLNERLRAHVRVAEVAAVIALKEDGPARLLFSGGGHLDVCGSAEIWRREIRLAELKAINDAQP